MRKIAAVLAVLTIATPAFAQQLADPVGDLKAQWQATMITGQMNLARSVDALIAAYQAVATKGAYWEDACKSTPECSSGKP